jgi:hypothetical protein
MIERRGGRHSDVPPERLAGEFARQVREARRNLRARGIPCLTVGYAECLRDPTAVAGRVSAFLGSCLSVVDAAGVVDPSLHRQRADRSG